MSKYKFCAKGSKEAISTTEASSESEAARIFAKIKNLKLEVFLKLYDIVVCK